VYKQDVINKLPNEIVDLARKGLYRLYENSKDHTLLVVTKDRTCFIFDQTGSYQSKLDEANIDYSSYEALDTINIEDIKSVANR
jgi:hypothetical protein